MQGLPLSECAILFAIPTNRRQFDAQVQTSDYIRKLLRGREVETAWSADYEGVAVTAQRLIDTAHRLGARVHEQATLADLRNATLDSKVVVLFAHWRGAKIDRDDLLAKPEVFWEKLRKHPRFRDSYAGDVLSVVDALNKAIEETRLLDELPPVLAAAARRSRSIGQTLCRDLLDEYLDGMLRPGNRLELSGALCTLGAIDEAIFAEFEGELDLALCHSEVVATFLDIRRGDRLRHLYWPSLLHPVPQLLKVAATLELLAKEGGGYIEKRLLLEEAELFK
jgi:hypothetical protein